METERHRKQMDLLLAQIEDAWRDRQDFYVAGNMALYFSETQALKNDFRAPDFFLVLDVERHERKRWVVWEEDGRAPDLVVELTSASTENIDRGVKMNVYARVLRVPIYAIYDPFSARLDVYALDVAKRQYVQLPPNERGWVWCAPVDMYLGVVEGTWRGIYAPWLRWIDRDGRPLEHERERADRAEAEVSRLRVELAGRDDSRRH